MMPENTMKRFYKSAGVQPSAEGWQVVLDGRPIKTPARQTVAVAKESLAQAIAGEWDSQGETVEIPSLHLTRLVNVALDRTPHQRAAMIEEVVKYCETDLLCFLADAPADLRARQIEQWRPVREWAGKALDVVLMEVPGGLLAAPQPPASLAAARRYGERLDDLRLTGLNFGLGLFGSALLSMAVCEGELTAETAYDHAILDELYQSEQWGKDEENEARLAGNRVQAKALGTFFSALL